MYQLHIFTLISFANIVQLLEFCAYLIAGRLLDEKKYEATPSITLERQGLAETPSYNFMDGSLKLNSDRFNG